MKYFRPNEDIREQKKLLLYDLKFPYRMKVSNARIYLKSSLGDYMTDNKRIPARELNYIKRVKDYIVNNKLYENIPRVSKSKIHDFRYSPEMRFGFKFGRAYEIDLKSAYWELANKLGLLQPSMYKLASTINPKTGEVYMSKETRLAAIGSLARELRIYEFDGKNEIMLEDNSPLTRHVWDYIQYRISEVMMKAMKATKKDFIFFWVDAAFVKSKKAAKQVQGVFKEAGYAFTNVDIRDMEVIDVGNDALKIDVNKVDQKAKKANRKFPFAPHKQKKI